MKYLINNKSRINRWQFCCLFILLTSCNNINSNFKEDKNELINKNKIISRAYDAINKSIPSIQTGDIITRTGNDFTSESLRSLNQRNQTYSHCGIASIENDSLFVYHSIGGDWNPNQKLKRDFFSDFTNPYDNRGFGVFRFNLPDSFKTNLRNIAKDYYKAGITFDMDFDLKTDNKMYCAEFVSKSLEKASHQSIQIPHSRIKDFEFIGVDDIFLHPNCKKINSFIFK